MAKNDILLIDQIVSEFAKDSGASTGDAFQAFAIGEVLKDYDLSSEEIAFGLVDGRDDGGIDAWFTFLDGDLISTAAASSAEDRCFARFSRPGGSRR